MKTSKILSKTLLLGLMAISPLAFSSEAERYTMADARNDNIIQFAGGLTTSIIGGNIVTHMDAITTHTFFATEGLPTQMTPELIDDIMKKTSKSLTGRLGWGSTGGGRLVIELDEKQLYRMVEAENLKNLPSELAEKLKGLAEGVNGKQAANLAEIRVTPGASAEAAEATLNALDELSPSFTNKTYNPRFIPGGYTGVKTELLKLQDAKIAVKAVTWQSFGKRALPAVGGTLVGVDVAFTIERGVASLIYTMHTTMSYDSDEHSEESFCKGEVTDYCGGFDFRFLFDAGAMNAPTLSSEEKADHLRELKSIKERLVAEKEEITAKYKVDEYIDYNDQRQIERIDKKLNKIKEERKFLD